MFHKCTNCGTVTETINYKKNLNVCSKCGYYGNFSFEDRILQIADSGTFIEVNNGLEFKNPINFPEYKDKYKAAVRKTKMKEAVITGQCKINGIDVMLAVMDNRFMMGSMGIVVGEKIVMAFEEAEQKKIPIIIFATSGGARMQEGPIALMQMAKTSAAIAKYNKSSGLFISVLTNPTTGGVSASFSFLGDIILAEPGALVGFAGKRVIEQTIHEKLPQGFQTAEYILEHGFLDAIVERRDMKQTLYQILKFHL